MLSIETVQSHIGEVREGRCLNTTAFPPDLRCLTYIMMFNLYPVKKLTTINNARAIFLMEFRENTYIDISAYIFCIIANETRTTSRGKLIFRSSLKGLTGFVMPRMSNLKGWVLSKSKWIFFQQILTASLPSSSPLAISVKKGEK